MLLSTICIALVVGVLVILSVRRFGGGLGTEVEGSGGRVNELFEFWLCNQAG